MDSRARIKLPVHQLSAAFVEDLQEKYGDAELEITINPNPSFRPLSEEAFWDLIALLDWDQEEDDAIVEPLIQQLAALPVGQIYNFQELLAQKLFQLDQQKYAENIGQFSYQKGEYFSSDHFLHVRACVVANGKAAFQEVLDDPQLMFKDLYFEALLSVASTAYSRKTAKPFVYVPSKSMETYSNKEGWGS